MKFIKEKIVYKFTDMQNVLDYDHQLKDDDVSKEILIEAYDSNAVISWLNRITETKVNFKSNSILLVDIVVYYPFLNSNQDKMRKWKEDSIDYIAGKFGLENIMAATFHESRVPHIHFAVIPIVNNRLCWSFYVQHDTIRRPMFEYDYINNVLQP